MKAEAPIYEPTRRDPITIAINRGVDVLRFGFPVTTAKDRVRKLFLQVKQVFDSGDTISSNSLRTIGLKPLADVRANGQPYAALLLTDEKFMSEWSPESTHRGPALHLARIGLGSSGGYQFQTVHLGSFPLLKWTFEPNIHPHQKTWRPSSDSQNIIVASTLTKV